MIYNLNKLVVFGVLKQMHTFPILLCFIIVVKIKESSQTVHKSVMKKKFCCVNGGIGKKATNEKHESKIS